MFTGCPPFLLSFYLACGDTVSCFARNTERPGRGSAPGRSRPGGVPCLKRSSKVNKKSYLLTHTVHLYKFMTERVCMKQIWNGKRGQKASAGARWCAHLVAPRVRLNASCAPPHKPRVPRVPRDLHVARSSPCVPRNSECVCDVSNGNVSRPSGMVDLVLSTPPLPGGWSL